MRKRICVIITGFEADATRMTIEGMSDQAAMLDYDMYVYTWFSLSVPTERTFVGAVNILKLIDIECFDAFIIDKTPIIEKYARDEIDSLISRTNKPVLNIGEPEQGCASEVARTEQENFRKMTEHLILRHGCREIWFLGGPQDNFHSQLRLAGWHEALFENGIEPQSDWTIYGDFWRKHACGLAEKIADGVVSMPDAIACAGTIPAVTLIEQLDARGIRVPQDIIITGYDYFAEGELCTPTVTTVSKLYNQGVRIMRQIARALNEHNPKMLPLTPEVIRPAESCGCVPQSDKMTRRFKQEQKEQMDYREWFMHSGMQELLSTAENADDFFSRITHTEYLMREIREVRYFLCDDWDSISNQQDTEYRNDGYSEQLHTYTHLVGKSGGYAIQSKCNLLQSLYDSETPRTYFFTPIHYEDRAFGFLCLNYRQARYMPDALFWSWSSLLCNSLETMRIRHYLSRFGERRHLVSVRDNLTGLYNRRGFEEFSVEMYEYAIIHRERFFLAVVDVHNIDELNGIYGYEVAGEIVLTLADFISRNIKGNEIACRTQNARFFVVGTHGTQSESIDLQKKHFLDACAKKLSKLTDKVQAEIDLEVYFDFITGDALSTIIGRLEQLLQKKHLHEWKYHQHIRSIHKLREELYKHPERKWTIDEMAMIVSLSRAYFQRMYKQTFGISASADLITARIEQAKRLLAMSVSITDTAEQCGYSSPEYFMTQFKRETGMTPTQWYIKETAAAY